MMWGYLFITQSLGMVMKCLFNAIKYANVSGYLEREFKRASAESIASVTPLHNLDARW
jgi:hypothetical protein